MRTLNLSLGLASVAAFLQLSSPAGAADQALIDAATKEGVVSWYTSLVESQAARPLANGFSKKYPAVKLELVTGKIGRAHV